MIKESSKKMSPRNKVMVISERRLTNIKKQMTCTICFDYIHDLVVTRCNHNFCRACILQALRIKNACPNCQLPTCRRELTPNQALE